MVERVVGVGAVRVCQASCLMVSWKHSSPGWYREAEAAQARTWISFQLELHVGWALKAGGCGWRWEQIQTGTLQGKGRAGGPDWAQDPAWAHGTVWDGPSKIFRMMSTGCFELGLVGFVPCDFPGWFLVPIPPWIWVLLWLCVRCVFISSLCARKGKKKKKVGQNTL